MRSLLGIGASALAALAAVVASDSRNGDIVPFFIALTFAGGVLGWAVHEPFTGIRRRIARGIALAWAVAAVWVGGLLLLVVAVWSSSGPTPVPEATYLGLPATVFHLAGLYGGFVLVLTATFAPTSWLEQRSNRVPAVAPHGSGPG